MATRIINFHCHPPCRFHPEQGITPESCDDILRSDEINLFCMSPLDLSGLAEDPEYPYMTAAFRSTNGDVARLRDRFPKKVVPFVYVDPREKGAAEEVRRWVKGEGFRGLKLYPPIGFYPDAPEILDFLSAVDDLALPILFHAGRVAPHPQLLAKYAQPIHLEAAAYAARKCAIVVGHAGNPWKDVTFALAVGVKNMYVDLTTGGGGDPDFIKRVLRHPEMGAGRMVWGSDGLWKSPKSLAQMRSKLDGIGATEEEKALVLGGTAERLLNRGAKTVME
jgi:predicted TIM-barrel fold metal-dependent hydrolase